MKTTTPAERDRFGVRHAARCQRPGWEIRPSTIPGWTVATCGGCGHVVLVRSSAPSVKDETPEEPEL